MYQEANDDHSSGKLVSMSVCPQDAYQLRKSPSGRLLVFEQSGGNLLIEFATYKIKANCLYYIPAGHYYMLPSGSISGEFLAIDIHCASLSHQYRYWLYHLKYVHNKSFPMIGHAKDDFFENLKSAEGLLLPIVSRQLYHWIQGIAGYRYGQRIAISPNMSRYVDVADQLMMLFEADSTGCHTPEQASRGIATHIQTLRRTTKSLFDMLPTEVINFHRLQTAFYLMVTEPSQPVSALADRLGFTSPSAFSRFVKRYTNLKPSDLKQCCLHLHPPTHHLYMGNWKTVSFRTFFVSFCIEFVRICTFASFVQSISTPTFTS